ncbi:MAG: Asp-tRNA(Asn)/Glu-tRNA(Gln) amidotransferase subunit GatA [Nanoarchaeota archaeon]|nr:Asp-tRNA(Asn)/Glu-tRNA(Gln) amidotransferase subunit GatA [Nanoarchaeota archaeon]
MTSTVENLQRYLDEIKKNDKQGKKINAFLQLGDEKKLLEEARQIDEKIKQKKAGKLAGKIIAVKANINVKGLNASCASKTLENYEATYDASVISKIKKEDGLIIGITNMDEFACGSSGETSAFGPCKNPQALELIPGGSSSGSAASVSAGFCDMALGSDTGGSIRNPASHCGVVGLKPTYSSVSRYGLIDLGMSLDQIGPFAKNVYDCALLFDVIKGKDAKDSISQDSKKLDLKEVEKIPKGIKVGVLDFKISDERIQTLIDNKIEQASKKYGWQIKKIKIDNIDLAIETYYPLVYVEFFSGTRKFDGRRYGKRIENSAGPEVIRRILGGSEISKAEYRGRYYHLALKVKKLIEEEFSKAFKKEKVDCIISPTVPRLPHKIGETISVEDMYGYDALTIPSNLAGNCAISIPAGKINNIPVGLQIMCDKFQEQKLLEIARGIEKMGEN